MVLDKGKLLETNLTKIIRRCVILSLSILVLSSYQNFKHEKIKYKGEDYIVLYNTFDGRMNILPDPDYNHNDKDK